MTTAAIKLELEPRILLGKKVRRLRREGISPVHLYGPGVDSRSLQCRTQRLIQVLSLAGGNTPIVVTVQGEGGEQLAFAREIQWDPKRDSILHVDLLVAAANRPVSAQVPVIMIGESAGARTVSGTVVPVLRNIEVEALPLEMPSQIEIDLSVLSEPDMVIRVGDISLPGNATMITDPEELVARIELPRVAVEEGVEGAPAAEATAGDSEAPAAESA